MSKEYRQYEAVIVEFWLHDKKFAGRSLITIPRKGEEVRFNKEVYKVENVLHIYDEDFIRVAVTIRPLKKGE